MADSPDKDQKTEEATPRKREEARAEGQVALSQEIISATMLACAIGVLFVGGGSLANTAAGITVRTIHALPVLGVDTWSEPLAARMLEESITPALKVILLTFLPVLAVGMMVGYGQVGLRLTPKAVKFDPSKISPAKGAKRLFSVRAVVRTTMALLKIIAIVTVMLITAYSQIDEIIRLGSSELGPMLAGLGKIGLRCTVACLVVVLLLALVDLIFQRMQHEKEMRMSKQEVKDEHKQMEGDPRVKARVRQVQRDMATRRMMGEVPEASVVITNPTHFAVALKYERAENGEAHAAPRVVAKGRDQVALRIREIAKENNVVVYEDPPLARALYAQVEIGEEIPEDFYAAIATVLSYVYRLQGSTLNV